MRQGNGSDLLGANDPRSATIGVIYVAQTDDKESVLAAVLTQEKLGRKQIAIVLPGQNKAFQRPGDFDDLKNMRRKLQAQLIIVAPQGSSPAEFARQRRFTFFSSLESYAKSLRDESEASRSGRRGLFGSRRPASPEENGNGVMPLPPPPSGLPDEQREPPNVIPPAAVIGVAGFVAGQEMPHPEEHAVLEPPQPNQQKHDDEDVVFIPPPPPGNAAPEEVPVASPPPMPPPVVVPYVDEDAHAVEGDIPGEDDDEAFPPVVPVVPYPYIVPVDDEEEPEPIRPILMPTPIPLRQSTGPRRAVVGGVVGGAVVAPPPTTGNGGSGGSRRKRSRWQLLLLFLIALLLLSLLLCGGIALAAPGTLGSAFGSLQKLGSNVISAPPTATVNIEPKSAQLVNTYIISGLPSGTPDSSQRQVAARLVTFTTQPQSKTVAATGQKKTVGTRATGTISFYNSSTSVIYVAANNVFPDAHGIQIATDSLVAIPAGNPAAGTYGHVTAPAHAVNIGTSGNLAAGDITNVSCCGNAAIGVSTTGAFTGGQDPQNYTVVQQSDLDNAANPLKPQLLQSALTSVNGLRHSNEQFVKNAQCSTKVASTPNVGDKAPSVTVNVTATCSGEVYDQVGAETIAANLLKSEEDKDLGSSYSLSGNIATAVTSVTADSKGKVSLLVKANGLWVYQFDTTAKANVAKLIAGKSQIDATSLLLLQAGISKVDSIRLSSGGTTLPTDPTQITITIVVPPVTVPGSPTVSPGSGSPSPGKSPGASPTTAGS